ncbi:glycosyltransferase [Halotalea alkalilenta]|uniref:Glycosyl transferase n=1 Tax=Halotalea alkalilenta TaxID=376489 RepID=A0A172YDN7_9GAMM|nr:glycosyltransferase family 2 protein [Halotalea alkalilenta]ANF57369.1 glycosyl transferase [Halotalea alkalilenta]
MIGICIPANDEQDWLDACLLSALAAARHPGLGGEPVTIVVVLDHCRDRTPLVAARHPVECLSIDACNVGAARAAGANHLLALGARWLAFTDADTRVSERWLVDQLSLKADAVCGTISIEDWSICGEWADALRADFEHNYQDREGHRHVHGANFGIDARAYAAVGGFSALTCSEDQALVDALQSSKKFKIAWSAQPRVATSARLKSRIADGFAGCLRHAIGTIDKHAS